MFGFDERKKVDLRGKSKKEDRQAMLARAAREREERQRMRERLRATVVIQAAYRAACDLRIFRATLRVRFDAELAPLDPASFAPHATNLVRDLLAFHLHSEPSDTARRRALLQLLLLSATRADAESNPCVRGVLADSRCWAHQMFRVGQLCVPHLLQAEVPATPSVELRMVGYLLNPSSWQPWVALLPPASVATLPSIATQIAGGLGRSGLHNVVRSALLTLLPPDAAGDAPVPEVVTPLLALSARALQAVCTGAPSEVLAFARDFLCAPEPLARVPPQLIAPLFRGAVAPLVKALAQLATDLPQLLAPSPAAAAAASAAASLAAADGPLEAALRQAALLTNVAWLVERSAAADAEGLGLGPALPHYTVLLHACCAPLSCASLRSLESCRALRAVALRAVHHAAVSPSLVTPPRCLHRFVLHEDQREKRRAAAAARAARLSARGRSQHAVVVSDDDDDTTPMDVDTDATAAVAPRTSAEIAALDALATRLSVRSVPCTPTDPDAFPVDGSLNQPLDRFQQARIACPQLMDGLLLLGRPSHPQGIWCRSGARSSPRMPRRNSPPPRQHSRRSSASSSTVDLPAARSEAWDGIQPTP